MPNKKENSYKLVELKQYARELLTNAKVDVVIGYQAVPHSIMAAPLIIHRVPDSLTQSRTATSAAFEREMQAKINALIFNDRCEINLVNYLHKFKDRRVAVVVKGCDSRSLVGLLQEKQVERDKLVIIGAPCPGVLDTRRIARALGGESPLKIQRDGDDLIVHGHSRSGRRSWLDALYAGCKLCANHNPILADVLLADELPQPQRSEMDPQLAGALQMSQAERREKFLAEMSKCILCYACRNLCPACYCNTCFTESSKPKWVGRTDDPSDAMLFHLQRLMHLGGRCTGCGACVRGCPMNVDLRLYNDFLRDYVHKEYGFLAGMDTAAKPPLAVYSIDDSCKHVH